MSTSVIYFGGWNWSQEMKTVAEFKNDNWSQLGEMSQPRRRHQSIEMNGKIYIIGGNGSRFQILFSQ